MNEDNNEAEGWACGSLEERELFGEGPNGNRGGPHECTKESMCSWCSMKEATKVHVCRNPDMAGKGMAFSGLSGPVEENQGPCCCALCEMSEEEWEEHREMTLRERETSRKREEKQYLEDGITLLGTLKNPGLGAHNKSIDLCIASFTDIFNSEEPNHQNCIRYSPISSDLHIVPAVYARSIIEVRDDSTDHQKSQGEKCISVVFRGKESGIYYKVDIIYTSSQADILASRIDEVLDANSSYPVSDGVLRGFIKATDFLKFQVYRGDKKNGWDYLCVDPGDDFGLWPGDSVAALLMCLHDDLTTALEPTMYTLRGGLHKVSKIAFLKGASKLSIHRLMAYEMAYKSIGEATSSMPPDDVYALVSRIKEKLSDPDYAREGPPAEVDYGLLEDEAWGGGYHNE